MTSCYRTYHAVSRVIDALPLPPAVESLKIGVLRADAAARFIERKCLRTERCGLSILSPLVIAPQATARSAA
ncbi:hypothetical protein VDG09_09050 [Xanthomonas campestris pv. raphani]|uniref:hypothetical protein n=1 Tax=Xanthomonas campestris TaxID=339 RepID=UPI0023E9C377|nr:hypothetical protein [Xanthomonas campestris]MCW2036519.1 hypothetical protein [Xanthomonas campestris]MEA9827798.1 hypothetical protein [Xanthomonas campestris pv. raphani]